MPLYCDKCGHKNENKVKNCQSCGQSLSDEHQDILMPGTMLDRRYEIKRLIKSGGMGAVYEALDHRFEKKPCAVKEMLPHAENPQLEEYFIKRFKKEALILFELRHQNLPGLIDYFIENFRYYLVMDYIEGYDLDTIMRQYERGRVPQEIVIAWSIEILQALVFLHSQTPPVVYRDMKPGNIMVRSEDQKIILVDFGIARKIDPESDTAKTVIGTPGFSPPEIFHGGAETRSDLYSLGATMHCLLTGMVPVKSFVFKPVRNLNNRVSKELEEIVMKVLSLDPEDRYENASQMKEALLKITGSSPVFPDNIIKTEAHLSQEEKTSVSSTGHTVPYQIFEEPEKTVAMQRKRSNKKILVFIITVIIILSLPVIFARIFYRQNSESDNLYKEGERWEKQGRYKEALMSYNKALEKEPDNIYILKSKGNLLYKDGKYDEAISCFDKATGINPSYKQPWNMKGLCLYEKKKYEEAVKCYTKALELDSKDSVVWYNKGCALAIQKKYDESLKCFDEVLKINPKDGDALKYKEKLLRILDK